VVQPETGGLFSATCTSAREQKDEGKISIEGHDQSQPDHPPGSSVWSGSSATVVLSVANFINNQAIVDL
jgi:hypothetical protein